MSITTSTSFGLTHRVSAYTLTTGVAYRKIIDDVLGERVSIDGVLCERVSIDGQWATIDGQPVYMEV